MQRSPIASSSKEKHGGRNHPECGHEMLKEVVHFGAQKLVTMLGLEPETIRVLFVSWRGNGCTWREGRGRETKRRESGEGKGGTEGWGALNHCSQVVLHA